MMRHPTIVLFLFMALLSMTEAARLKGFKRAASLDERSLKHEGGKKSKKKGPSKRTCFGPSGTALSELFPKSRFACSTPDLTVPIAWDGDWFRRLQEDTEGEEESAVSDQTGDGIQYEDEIKYTIETSEKGIHVTVGYNAELTEDGVGENQLGETFEFQFESLVEYVKTAGSNISDAYDWSTDEIVQVIPFTSWTGLHGNFSHQNGTALFFQATSELNKEAKESAGVAQFNFTVSDTSGAYLDANSIRIEIRILDFPWERDNSYIALMASVNSTKNLLEAYNDEAVLADGGSQPIQNVFIDFEKELEELGLEVYGEYTWEATTDAKPENNEDPTTIAAMQENLVMSNETNATTVKVVATSSVEATASNFQQIAYSFIGNAGHQATEIFWHTIAGVSYYDFLQEDVEGGVEQEDGAAEVIAEEEVGPTEEDAESDTGPGEVAEEEAVSGEVVQDEVVEEEEKPSDGGHQEVAEEEVGTGLEGSREKEDKPKPGKGGSSEDDSGAPFKSFGAVVVLSAAVSILV